MAAAAPIGSVSVGRHRLDVGGAAGTLIAPSPAPPEGDAAPLARALEQEPRTAGEAAEEIVDSASEVATRVEQAVALAKDLAAARIDPRDVSGHVDLMLDMLGRLDGEGRWEEERRLARALNGVLALLFRWVDLVRSLKVVRAAAERSATGPPWRGANTNSGRFTSPRATSAARTGVSRRPSGSGVKSATGWAHGDRAEPGECSASDCVRSSATTAGGPVAAGSSCCSRQRLSCSCCSAAWLERCSTATTPGRRRSSCARWRGGPARGADGGRR
ncbi:MAG TPA: hypothetical protein VI122_21610 [Thermoleophilaceae bacterium]